MREHLRSSLDPSPEGLLALEAQLNQALHAQLPPWVWRLIRRGRVEVAGDLTDLPYHVEPEQSEAEIRRSRAKSGTTHFHSYATLQIGHHRQSSREGSLTEIEVTRPLPDPAPGQLEELLQREKAAIVRQVINDLPTERDRQVLFRFYIAEEGKEQICADLGLDSLHFNRVLFRARQRYKELYEKAISKR